MVTLQTEICRPARTYLAMERFKIVELVGPFQDRKLHCFDGNEIERVPRILYRSDGICRRVHSAEGT